MKIYRTDTASSTVPPGTKLTIRPLTPDLWPALQDLFGKNGACNGCWCMYWRIGALYHKRPREKNKAAFRRIVKRGPPPGLLAFDGDAAVGWCQLTPRDLLPWLDRSWRLERVDDLPVWSLSCFYVRKGYRRQGITSALIAAALKAARRARAPALEAYPLDADKTPSASGTGYASTFARAGFKTVARRVAPRPIMRHDLKSIASPEPRSPRPRNHDSKFQCRKCEISPAVLAVLALWALWAREIVLKPFWQTFYG